MLSYRDALSYIYGFTDYEKQGFAAYAPEFYDLGRVRCLLALLGEPQRSFQAVHIAGTKGKGSTAAMIESVLRAAGYRTGLYTSPHLHTFRERIQVGGELIPEADVARLIESMQPLVAQVPDITTFEIMTGLAFTWFAAQGVAWAVVEVGLGGRLDATNVVVPAVAVITSISYDHMVILGDTLTQIAAEKAGIVKPGVPVVSAPQSDEALVVVEVVCGEQGAPLTLVGRDWSWELGAANLDGQTFSIHHGQEAVTGLWLPLLGEHQVVNATTAVAALSLLAESGVNLSEAAIRDGLRAVYWPARLEILGRAPLVVADSAHNGDSAGKLMAALRDLDAWQRLTVVLGGSKDHITPEVMTTLLSGAHRAIATHSRHPRAADPAWLQTRAAEMGFSMEVSETVAQALDLALAEAGPEDLVCCTGSVFVAAEARAAWFARQGMVPPPSDPASP
jgi:dihydrofolate synthase/folylpolyglutamate synthase